MGNLDEEKQESHESYGLVGFSRVSIGGTRKSAFFGSDLEHHFSCVRLVVSRGVRIRGDGHDHFFGKDHIIEVDLTSSQFGELLTTMNVGSGVPCTIRYLNGKQIPPPPEVDTVADVRRATFERRAREVSSDLHGLVGRMREAFSDKSVSKGTRDQLLKDLERAVMGIDKNLPYFLETFHEATREMVDQAKSEVSSYVAQAAMAAGIEALASGGAPNLLPDGRKDGDPK